MAALRLTMMFSVLQLNWEYERMKRHVWWTACSLVLTLGIWLVTVSGTQSGAADQDAKTAILKLADGKGDPEAIAKTAELGDFMNLFKPRAKKGIGVGDKP